MDRVAIYVRVSTNEQTTENQKRLLIEIAKQKNWFISSIYEDNGISGTKGREKRPAYDQLCTAMQNKEFARILVWDISRLGRSLKNLVEFLNDVERYRCDLYIHQSGLDTSTPAGKMMFQMVGVFSEFERSMISERVKLGLQRVKLSGKRIGRPKTITIENEKEIYNLKEKNYTNTQIANVIGISKMTIGRIIKSNQHRNQDKKLAFEIMYA